MQVLNLFGDGQNCQNWTFKWPYLLDKSKYEVFTVILFHMYQVFSFLLDHPHFSEHFFFFKEQLFMNHPLSICQT